MVKNILVTGGAGYIGAHTVVSMVKSGYEPVIIDNFSRSDRALLDGIEEIIARKVTFFEGNCLDKEFLRVLFKSLPISCVMHFAAFKSVGESVEKPLDYYQNNIGSMVTLLEVMGEFGVKDFIFSSSCTVYGEPDHVPVSEDAPFKQAESPYGATKQMCERILEDTSHTGLRVVSLRYFNPIGAHPSSLLGELPTGVPSNLVPYITQTAIGKREKVIVFGTDYNTPDGSCIRDFIHVMDLADAHVKAMEYLDRHPAESKYQVFNLGTGFGISVLQLINKFEESTGVKVNYVLGARRPGDIEKTYADPTKANKSLGWRTIYSIDDALLHAWNWELRLSKMTS